MRFKKNRKKKGHISASHDCIGKHCKHLRGHGNTGGMHHLCILFKKYHPDYFGKVDMHYLHKTMNKFECPIVKVDKLWLFMLEAIKEQTNSAKSTLLLDVTQHGFFKVFGKDDLPIQSMVVKAKFFSKLAKKKMKEAKGAVILIV